MAQLLTCNPFESKQSVEKIWRYLESLSLPNFYLSWQWMDCWIDMLDSKTRVLFHYVEHDGQPVLAFFTGLKRGIEHKIIYAKRGFLNATGIEEFDAITIQHNGLLKDPEFQDAEVIARALSESYQHFDELWCSALSESGYHLLEKANLEKTLVFMDKSKSFYVDLNKVRAHSDGLLSLVSKNKKSQIKRSIKAYSKNCELTFEVAQTKTEAKDILKSLTWYHQERWHNKQQQGSFENSCFSRFHSLLIERYFDPESIHLIRITSDNEPVGFLYNFISGDEISLYQCGFNYKPQNIYRPGLVSHYLAIQFYANEGMAEYNFGAGESRYKKSLSSDWHNQYWIKIQTNLIRFQFENVARQFKQRLAH